MSLIVYFTIVGVPKYPVSGVKVKIPLLLTYHVPSPRIVNPLLYPLLVIILVALPGRIKLIVLDIIILPLKSESFVKIFNEIGLLR